jgi:glycosyltransferase involved in cell wall biosynthesis
MKDPAISVIIPTFNNAGLLPETLTAVRQQTVRDLEIIVVDDGSTDDTAAVVKQFDPAIVYCHQANQRQAAARNTGAGLARGEYLAFCDHDDLWNPTHLELLLQCFAQFPEAAMSFDNAQIFGDGDLRDYVKAPISRKLHHRKIGAKFLLTEYPVASMSVVMVKKECFQSLGGLAPTVGVMDDYHFYLRLATRREIRYVDSVGCRKRVTDTNLSKLTNLKEMNVQYLEDIRENYPEVIRKIGAFQYNSRLARKYFKLGRHYAGQGDGESARKMYRRAFATQYFNPRYLYHAIRLHH